MGANPTTYCLENLTDYAEFERLCDSLMILEGYSKLEPLGKFKDKGRDAIHVDKTNKTTIFAYSAREDWRAKLSEDAEKIKRYGHDCSKLVFISTSEISAGERDEAIAAIKREYSWELELFPVARLQLLIDVSHPSLKQDFPQIFPPAFIDSDYLLEKRGRDHVLINYAQADKILAIWLTNKLVAAGYRVWCAETPIIGEDAYPENVNERLATDVFATVAIISNQGQSDVDSNYLRKASILTRGVITIPIEASIVDRQRIDSATLALPIIDFLDWKSGLIALTLVLESKKCPRQTGQGLALMPGMHPDKNVFIEKSEKVLSNFFEIKKLPKAILQFKASQEIPWDLYPIPGSLWGARIINSRRYLSLIEPPAELASQFGVSLWKRHSIHQGGEILGIDSKNLRMELIRKAIMTYCLAKGLKYCKDTRLLYFPVELLKNDKLFFFDPILKKETFVTTCGRRKYWKPSGEEYYKYFLAPSFNVTDAFTEKPVLQIRIRIRLTDDANKPLPRFKANSRRKHLCRDWWNHEWLKRVLAVSEFLFEGRDFLEIGGKQNSIVIFSRPIAFISPISVNENSIMGEVTQSEPQFDEEDEE